MSSLAMAQSATLALSAGTRTLSTATGVVILAGAWVIHHKLAHRHGRLRLLANVLIAAGATILFASAGASLLQSINSWTAGRLGAIAKWAKLGGTWPNTIGLLTLIEIILLLWIGIHVWDAVRGRKGRAMRAGTARGAAPLNITSAAPSASGTSGRSWAWLEHQLERYGFFAAGPLTVTLPATAGALAAAPFGMLASFVGHLVGSPFGIG